MSLLCCRDESVQYQVERIDFSRVGVFPSGFCFLLLKGKLVLIHFPQSEIDQRMFNLGLLSLASPLACFSASRH